MVELCSSDPTKSPIRDTRMVSPVVGRLEDRLSLDSCLPLVAHVADWLRQCVRHLDPTLRTLPEDAPECHCRAGRVSRAHGRSSGHAEKPTPAVAEHD
jgi:hypothetical protein